MEKDQRLPTDEGPLDDNYVTMVFGDDQTYINFTDYVYDQIAGPHRGLEITDAPLQRSIRVRPSLLHRVPADLTNGLRPVTQEDIQRTLEGAPDEDVFDLGAARQFHFVALRPPQE